MKPSIILLGGKGQSTNIMYNALQSSFEIEKVIIEVPVRRKQLIKKRIKKLGFRTVAGQVLFMGICVPILKYFSSGRRISILKKYNLDDRSIPPDLVVEVPSVNSFICIRQLKKINSKVIVVNGTRIISRKVLKKIPSIFLNTHVGITPKYRGVHGGYWALVNKDKNNCGVTVHLIDTGIDTGSILYQELISPSSQDNFTTYPLIQMGEGIPLMKKAINDVYNNAIQPQALKSKLSNLWYHPTIWFYLYNRVGRGIK